MATIIAVDVAKSVFEVAVSERAGRVREHHRLSRAQFSRFLSVQRPATILMEACGMAHFWGRQAQARGHRVMLLPPHAVRPYVPRNKTDRADAKGILEASRNQAIRSVPVKSITQQTIAALHRLRSTWLAARTARINTVRGLLREFGVVIPVGASHVVPRVRQLVAEPLSVLPEALRPALTQAADEIREPRDAYAPSRSSSTPRPSKSPPPLAFAPCQASAFSPPRLCSPSSVTSSVSRREDTSRATSASLPESPRAGCADDSAGSASTETRTCGCCSFTVRVPCSGMPRQPRAAAGSNPGR